MTTHRTSADYYAGIPQYPGRITPADLNAAKEAAWDEGWMAGLSDSGWVVRRSRNPYRASNVEGMNQ